MRFRSFRSRFSDSKSRWFTWVDTRSWGSGLCPGASSCLPQAHSSPYPHSQRCLMSNDRGSARIMPAGEKPQCAVDVITHPTGDDSGPYGTSTPPVPSSPCGSQQSPLTWSLSVATLFSSSRFSRSTFCLSSYSSSSC